MYSNYRNVYNQNLGSNSYTSNSKFLRPSASVYGQPCRDILELRDRIPSYFKYNPENLKVNPEIQGNFYRENYIPPRCEMCTKGGMELPGAGYYGMQGSKKLGTDILKNPSFCNYNQSNKHVKEIKEIKEDYCNTNDSDNVITVKRNMISFAPPNKWGPKAWDFFHSVSFSYPTNPTSEQQAAALDFFKALPFMLPCSTCGKHCEQQLKQFPPDVRNRETLTKWLYNFHNLINQRLGKEMPSFDEIKRKHQL